MQPEKMEMLKSAYEVVHDRIVPFMQKMEEDKIRKRIIPLMNPVAWMIWHVLRVEDMFLSNVVFRKEQAFHKDGWQERLGIRTAHVGTGMSTKEADELAGEIDLNALKEYNLAIREHSMNLIRLLPEWPSNELDDAQEIEKRLLASDAFPTEVAKERSIAYAPTPVSTCVLGVVNHTYMHFGQYLVLTKPL